MFKQNLESCFSYTAYNDKWAFYKALCQRMWVLRMWPPHVPLKELRKRNVLISQIYRFHLLNFKVLCLLFSDYVDYSLQINELIPLYLNTHFLIFTLFLPDFYKFFHCIHHAQWQCSLKYIKVTCLYLGIYFEILFKTYLWHWICAI